MFKLCINSCIWLQELMEKCDSSISVAKIKPQSEDKTALFSCPLPTPSVAGVQMNTEVVCGRKSFPVVYSVPLWLF